MNRSVLPRVALIAGPTASGKSALALAIAEAFGGTIVNADSAQVYRDLRILTARPSVEDEARVPHRLFGHVDAADAGHNAARWAGEAAAAIDAIIGESRLPILVGGTGLYLRTLLDGIAPVPAIDPSIRAAVRTLPVAEAHGALARADPTAAARLAPADTTRVARALEVVLSTGRPLSYWQAERVGGIGKAIDLIPTLLLPDRALLENRIAARATAMFAQGAIDEVAALLSRTDVGADAPIRRTIGVPVLADLLAGRTTCADAETQLVLDTRRYAKRQFTWFRRQPPDTWPTARDSESAFAKIAIRLHN